MKKIMIVSGAGDSRDDLEVLIGEFLADG